MTRPISRQRAAALIAALALAPAAHAQTMHWFWNVDINGQPADTSQPVLVAPGDAVRINLSTQWDDVADVEGFAASIFSIGVVDGDATALFNHGTLDYSQANGLGRNPVLSSLSTDNGTPLDSDHDGLLDTLDLIDTFQLPEFFNANFDPSEPMSVYTMEWTVGLYLFEQITLQRVAADNGTFTSHVYADQVGTIIPMTPLDDQLTLRYVVPAPGSALCLGLLAFPYRRRR